MSTALGHFIDGHSVASADGRTLDSVDPSDETVIAAVALAGDSEVDRAVQAAARAMRADWRAITPMGRGALLHRLADLVTAQRKPLAELEMHDSGKPRTSARGDIDGVVATLRYNAGAADKIEGAVIPLGRDVVDFTMLEPLGVTAHVVPWNFPLGMAVRSLAPALAAGCTAVIKPAEQSPLSVLRFAELALRAGFPPGVVNVVCGTGAEAGAALVAHPLVRGVSFTGSVAAGRAVAVAAARGLKPCVLELGGKNAMIVCADADPDRVIEAAMEGGFDNAGQVCSASSRLLVHEDMAERLTERLAARVAALRVGPADADLDMGPLISASQQARVLDFMAQARRDGARAVTGGGRAAGLDRGYFVAPTLFADVDPALPIATEEVFGPVITISRFRTDAQALALANALPTGLVAGVFTSDIGRALRMAQELETGSVWINGWFLGGVQAPTGGMKDSGIGRERGMAGLRNFLQTKNVAIRL